MKNLVYLLALILLALAAGCDLNIFDKDDNDAPMETWSKLDAYDFPIYIGNFADYEHTDAEGTSLGTVAYGYGGDDKDWQVFSYEPSDCGTLPTMPDKAGGSRDEYHILIRAVCEFNGYVEIAAAIQCNGIDTGFYSPHTFSYQGTYDPALENSFVLSHPNYNFLFNPEISFAPDTNTYSYVFQGIPKFTPPPWDSFSATLDEQCHVLLRWVIGEETNLLGFKLYRSITNDLATAQMINPELIPTNNTGEEPQYSYTDTNVSAGLSYYYWLEKVFDGHDSTIYGPQTILMPPAENSVSPAYPNPCQDYFRLPVEVKIGCSATVLVLDSRLSVRQTYTIEQQGYYTVPAIVQNLEPGLYRVFIWFSDGHYAYGDVLIERGE